MDTDSILLEKYCETRDAESFAEIVRRYASMVYGTCLRVCRNEHAAEDATQECFLQLARKAETVRASLGGWLYKVAVTQSLAARRGEARRRRREELAAREGHADMNGTTPWQEISPVVDEAIRELSDAQREAIILRYMRQMSQSEIGEMWEVSQPTVHRRIEEAVEALRRRLRKKGVTVAAALLATLLFSNCAKAAPPPALMTELGKMAATGIASGSAKAAGSAVIVKVLAGACAASLATALAVGYYFTRLKTPSAPPPVQTVAQATTTTLPQSHDEGLSNPFPAPDPLTAVLPEPVATPLPSEVDVPPPADTFPTVEPQEQKAPAPPPDVPDARERYRAALQNWREIATKANRNGVKTADAEDLAEIERKSRQAQMLATRGQLTEAAAMLEDATKGLQEYMARLDEVLAILRQQWTEVAQQADSAGLGRISGEAVEHARELARQATLLAKQNQAAPLVIVLRQAIIETTQLLEKSNSDLALAEADWDKTAAEADNGILQQLNLHEWLQASEHRRSGLALARQQRTAEAAVEMRLAADGFALSWAMARTIVNAPAAEKLWEEIRNAPPVKWREAAIARLPELERLVPLSVTLRGLKWRLTGQSPAGSYFLATPDGRTIIEFIQAPAGKYEMGANTGNERTHRNHVARNVKEPWEPIVNASPSHPVTIAQPFRIARFEITQAQWVSVMGDAPWTKMYPTHPTGSDFPAYGMTGSDINRFMRKFESQVRGSLLRLPTEAEWEYVCRAGTDTVFCCGNSAESAEEYGWLPPERATRPAAPMPAGLRKSNDWGVFDMHGNVSEYCANLWYPYDPLDADNMLWQDYVAERPYLFITRRDGNGSTHRDVASWYWSDDIRETPTGFRPIIRPPRDAEEDVVVRFAEWREQNPVGGPAVENRVLRVTP